MMRKRTLGRLGAASDGRENGHAFDPVKRLCAKCGISQEAYISNGRLRCGELPDSKTKPRVPAGGK